MQIVMETVAYEDRKYASLQVEFSRKLANNASEIHHYEDCLEKMKGIPHATREEIDHLKEMIDNLYEERETLSEKYMKALRENK